jgi:hypothetical protein
MIKERRFDLALSLVLALGALVAYRNVIDLWFVTSDSIAHFAEGIYEMRDSVPYLRGPAMEGTGVAEVKRYYRPVSELSYGIDFLIHGIDVPAARISNILLHAATAFLTYLTGKNVLKLNTLPSAAAAIAFLLHPVGMQVVPSLSRRHDILMSVFGLLALLAHQKALENQEKLLLGFTGVFVLASVLSKEAGVIVLPILVAQRYFMTRVDSLDNPRAFVRNAFKALKASKWLAPLIALYFGIRLFGLGGLGTTGGGNHSLVQAVHTLAGYTLAMLRPSALINGFVPSALKTEVLQGALVPTAFGPVLLAALAAILITQRKNLSARSTRHIRSIAFVFSWLSGYAFMLLLSGSSALRYAYFPTVAATLLGAALFMEVYRSEIALRNTTLVLIAFIGLSTLSFNPLFYDFKEYNNSATINQQAFQEIQQYNLTDPTYIDGVVAGIDYNQRRITNIYYFESHSIEAWEQMRGRRDIEVRTISTRLKKPPRSVSSEVRSTDPLRLELSYR